MTTTIAKIRAQQVRKALRSGGLIRDALVQQLGILDQGGVPEQDFTASVTTYLRALDAIRFCDAVTEGEVLVDAADLVPVLEGQVLVDAADLVQVLGTVRVLVPGADGDSPLTRLEAAAAASSGQPENQEGTP